MPTIGGAAATSTRRWGPARWCPTAIFPSRIDTGYDLPGAAGPNAVLVRLRRRRRRGRLASLQRIAQATARPRTAASRCSRCSARPRS